MWTELGLAVVCGTSIAMLVLCLPLELELWLERERTQETPRWDLNLAWFSGRLRIRLGNRGQRPKDPPAVPVRRARRGRWSWQPFVQTKLVGRAVMLVMRALQRIGLKRFVVDGRVGFDDPALTGMVVGSLFPLVTWSNSQLRSQIRLTPEFSEEALDGRIDLSVDAVPAKLLYDAAWFVSYGPLWRALWHSRWASH